MTASASILATFAQPASRLATGDAAGAAMGGFEALLAMLTQSLQGGEAASGGEASVPPSTEAPAGDEDLAALLSQAGAATWLAQALSQTTPEADAATTSGNAPQAAPALAPMTRADQGEEAADAGQTAPVPPAGVDTADLESLLPGQTFEAANQSPLAWRKPMADLSTAQLPGRPQPVAAPAAQAAAPVVETAIAAQVLAAEAEAAAQPSADTAAEVVAETVAAPAVLAPPVEAKTPAPPRKAATDGKVAKVEASDAKPAAAPADAIDIAEAATSADDAAPAELAAREDEAPAAPARTGDTAVQTLAARLETVAANATALAAQVRGAPETVAKLAAGILDKLEGQSTRFDLQLDPHGLGKVDVSVEIGSDGKLTAQLGFDSQMGLSELRGRAQELRTALEQAGFTLTDNALNFDFSGERRQQQAADTQTSNSDQAGKAFAQAMGALDDEPAAASTRYQARRGLDLLI